MRERLPYESLHSLYHSGADQINTLRFQLLVNEKGERNDLINLYFFPLLFDAFKIFPEFKSRMQTYPRKQKNAWIRAIQNAKGSGEIKPVLTGEQIAQIFLFTSDGLTMNFTMEYNTVDPVQ